ncbi:MAG: ferrous iron transport protein B [Chloroflexota bacterium]|jgi:ferrous iron transport protein B
MGRVTGGRNAGNSGIDNDTRSPAAVAVDRETLASSGNRRDTGHYGKRRHRHCHSSGRVQAPTTVPKIALVGNPNTGKSVVFNIFTGLYVDVSNFPGTTVDVSQGWWNNYLVIDTPGVYGVSSFNDEERVTRDIILQADLVVNVVDAVHLERDLFLTLQLIDMGLPMVVVLNMMDEADAQQLKIDVHTLEEALGVPVVAAAAVEGRGADEMKAAIPKAQRGKIDPSILQKINAWYGEGDLTPARLLAAEGDEDVAARFGLPLQDAREELYIHRRQRVNDLVAKVLVDTRETGSFREMLGHWMVQPITGIPFLGAILVALYYLIGDVIAQQVVGFTEETVMQGIYEPFMRSAVESLFPADSPIAILLAGEFGLLTMTVTYLVGLLLPLVVGFYLAIAIMEDSGYLPRLAALVDRALTGIGLNGRAIVPMILGLGCVTMATMSTRILGSQRERRIAIVLLGLTIPCSAQLAVITAMLAGLGPGYVALFTAIIVGVLVAAGTLLNWLMPGKSTGLLIDLPPLRMPRLANVLRKSYSKTIMFLSDAAPLFAIGSLLLGGMQITGALQGVQDLLAPITVGWLQLPREAATAFVMGFVRRDFGAAGLLGMDLTNLQTLVALVTITLFVPCVASVMMMFKERGWKEASLLWIGCLVVAFLVGGVVSQLLI